MLFPNNSGLQPSPVNHCVATANGLRLFFNANDSSRTFAYRPDVFLVLKKLAEVNSVTSSFRNRNLAVKLEKV